MLSQKSGVSDSDWNGAHSVMLGLLPLKRMGWEMGGVSGVLGRVLGRKHFMKFIVSRHESQGARVTMDDHIQATIAEDVDEPDAPVLPKCQKAAYPRILPLNPEST